MRQTMQMPSRQVNQQTPFGGTRWDGDTVTSSYDPRLLQDFWNQTELRQGQRDMWGRAAGRAAGSMEVDPRTGLPALQTSVDPTRLQTGFSRRGFAGIPGATDFGGERQRVEDSMFDRFASRAGTRFDERRTALGNDLRDQGFTADSEGYDREMRDLGFEETDAYEQAARAAIAGGGAEQSRMLADALRVRGQQEGEGRADYDMWNQAAQQGFGQRLASGAFGNNARQQQFGENVGAGNLSRDWLATTQGGTPQGTMLPQFDLGLQGIDQDQATRNRWMAGLEGLLGPMITAGMTPGRDGASPFGAIAGQVPGWMSSIFNRGGDGLNGLAPEDVYGDGSGWGADVMPWSEDDPFGLAGWGDGGDWMSNMFADDPFGVGGW